MIGSRKNETSKLFLAIPMVGESKLKAVRLSSGHHWREAQTPNEYTTSFMRSACLGWKLEERASNIPHSNAICRR
jgi:hypothetical protein